MIKDSSYWVLREVLKLLRKGTDADPLSHQCWPSQDLRGRWQHQIQFESLTRRLNFLTKQTVLKYFIQLVLYDALDDDYHCCCALRKRVRLWLGPSVQAGGPPHVCPVISLSGCEDATLVATVGAAGGVAGDAEDPLQQFPIFESIYT
ncbi:hypothetical protein G4B88_008914 [Cannabis sativa]|uniref:Uncharacterized protein n=1 Tax=Cannabis sativa TaxID=3483 RepID=A0A7J6HQR6_CANSA|nr:hypothetical protein G4B88_008914 [Cannabis sativa]